MRLEQFAVDGWVPTRSTAVRAHDGTFTVAVNAPHLPVRIGEQILEGSQLFRVSADGAVIDVGGVGYQLLVSARTLDALGPVGGEVKVLTELQVREDAWTLFGFGSAAERDSFRALTGVQGVGGKVALAILSTLSPDELARAVAQDDKAMIGRASGV